MLIELDPNKALDKKIVNYCYRYNYYDFNPIKVIDIPNSVLSIFILKGNL